MENSRDLIFLQCLMALERNDFDVIEELLNSLRLQSSELKTVALVGEIRTRALRKKQALSGMFQAGLTAAGARLTPRARANLKNLQPASIMKLDEPISQRFPLPCDSLQLRGDGLLLSARDRTAPMPGTSLVTGCMNRQSNLLAVLKSWLATDADEIIIVDWSSQSDVWSQISNVSDTRIKVVRIDGEPHWVAAHALNVGLRFASHEVVFRLDCDINIAADFLKINLPRTGEFCRGFWKSGLAHGGEGQQFIHGTFGAFKKDLRAANYYDERILTYGWEDSELYQRLAHDLGLAARQIDPRTLRHIEQSQEQRTANQAVSRQLFLGRFASTEFEGAKNRYYTSIAGVWGAPFPFQDYYISEEEPRFYRGTRVTERPRLDAEFMRLAETLAAKQLAVWAIPSFPQVGNAADISIEFSKLLRDAHAINKSQLLIEGIASGNNVLFIGCEFGPCCAALYKTLDVLRNHYPSFGEFVVLADSLLMHADEDPLSNGAQGVLFVSGKLLRSLAQRTRSEMLTSLGALVKQFSAGNRRALNLSISVQSIAEEAIAKAAHFSERLEGVFEAPAAPVPASFLVTSLYDEHNLLRLIEYLACIVSNLRAFERIAICYESNNGLLPPIIQEIVEKLQITPGRLLLLPYQKRPTFEVLFSLKTLVPEGTMIAVANADIAFDVSLSKVGEIDLSRNIVVLSRYDIAPDGESVRLIRLGNGTPNTFSADAWIFKTPFEQDFFLDYPIGTFHCDSYINHQISRSNRYNAVNPCLDVRAFHLHDDRFNSSSEKQARDVETIQKRYANERERNGDIDPIRGVAWTTTACASMVPAALQTQSWRPKALFLELYACDTLTFGHLLVLHFILSEMSSGLSDAVAVIRLRKADLEGTVGRLLMRCQAHFEWKNVMFDLANDPFDPAKALLEGTICRTTGFMDVANWITAGDLQKGYDFFAWPSDVSPKFLRCEIAGNLPTEATLELLRALRKDDQFANELLTFFNTLPNYSPERNLLTPYIVPHFQSAHLNEDVHARLNGRPSVSFVTSLFDGGDFLEGYLENVVLAAQEVNGEVIIIDANPDDRDSRRVIKFLDEHPDARNYVDYLKLDRDPGLYECWKIGIERSKADLVTNANIDDRRCPRHTARLVKLLNDHPEYAGACGSISCVTLDGTAGWFALYDNQLWFFGENIHEISFDDLYRISDQGEVQSRDVLHCMPVWRKCLHERYGYFDEVSYGTSADWAFWLKCTKAGERFVFDEAAFGRYFMNPDSHNRRNDPESVKERRIVKDLLNIDQMFFRKQ